MNITYFIRDNDNYYSEPCDKANIKIKKDNKIYYCAACWGSHAPTDVVNFIVTDTDNLNLLDWLNSLSYIVIKEEV